MSTAKRMSHAEARKTINQHWESFTPDERPDDGTNYRLVMFTEGWGSTQNVLVTRDEFLKLKNYLAKLRRAKPVNIEDTGDLPILLMADVAVQMDELK